MNEEALRWMQCPFCLGSIRLNKVVKGSGVDIEHALLGCSDCGLEYPVIGGVAIIQGPDDVLDIKDETTAARTLRGPLVSELVDLLKGGDPVRALSRLLRPMSADGHLFPTLKVPKHIDNVNDSRVFHQTLRVRRRGRIWRAMRYLYRRQALPFAQYRLAQFLESEGPNLSALDVIDLYYWQYSGVEMFNYFAFRFGQPRHLAALALATLLGGSEEPLLDLACGIGHLTHFFTCTQPSRPVFGVDRDFFRLYLASRYVAPAGNFICAPADQSLPFSKKVFIGIFCSDAFHCFLHRAASVREMQRLLSDDGVLILSRFGNVELEPREGYELSLEGYRRLFSGTRHVFLGEDALVSSYLKKRGPDLATEAPPQFLGSQKWLSVVASRNLDKLPTGSRFADWPHATGRLQINPIYVADRQNGHRGPNLRFQFPSPWYEFENRRYREYAPESCVITPELVEALGRNEREPEMEFYLDQFVVLGMPDRYRTPSRWRATSAQLRRCK
jgi:SAM-dependent methyltransferase/uncharacterized protein YbaR (Trm112 family)